MSSGIMERNLPVAESLGSGDKVRIVTSAGNSKQIDASEIGGGGVSLIGMAYEEESTYIPCSYNDIIGMVEGGVLPVVYEEDGGAYMFYMPRGTSYSYSKYRVAVSRGGEGLTFVSDNADDPRMYLDEDPQS